MKEYNITFIATLFALAFGRLLGPRRAYWLIITGITLYVLLVGADAAVVSLSPRLLGWCIRFGGISWGRHM